MKNQCQIVLLTVFFLITNVSIFSQDARPGSEVPPGSMSMLVVPDPKCPIQIKAPLRFIGYSYGGFELGFTLENTSDANIESFSLQEWDWFFANGYDSSFKIAKERHFVPGMTKYSLEVEEISDLIPFDQNKGLQSHVFAPRNKIWIVMVTKVTLADGRTYDSTEKFEKLEKFVSNMDGGIQTEELIQREIKLREFAARLMFNDK